MLVDIANPIVARKNVVVVPDGDQTLPLKLTERIGQIVAVWLVLVSVRDEHPEG
jgi:hypothetical protein